MYDGLQGTLRNSDASLLGNFSLLHIDWLTGSEGESHKMLDFIEDNRFSEMISEPTHGNNILDLVLLTQENLDDNVSVCEHHGSCDHRVARLDI